MIARTIIALACAAAISAVVIAGNGVAMLAGTLAGQMP